jgi:hypothetical protein
LSTGSSMRFGFLGLLIAIALDHNRGVFRP